MNLGEGKQGGRMVGVPTFKILRGWQDIINILGASRSHSSIGSRFKGQRELVAVCKGKRCYWTVCVVGVSGSRFFDYVWLWNHRFWSWNGEWEEFACV